MSFRIFICGFWPSVLPKRIWNGVFRAVNCKGIALGHLALDHGQRLLSPSIVSNYNKDKGELTNSLTGRQEKCSQKTSIFTNDRIFINNTFKKKITYARSLVNIIYTGVGNYLGCHFFFYSFYCFVDFFCECDFKFCFILT